MMVTPPRQVTPRGVHYAMIPLLSSYTQVATRRPALLSLQPALTSPRKAAPRGIHSAMVRSSPPTLKYPLGDLLSSSSDPH